MAKAPAETGKSDQKDEDTSTNPRDDDVASRSNLNKVKTPGGQNYTQADGNRIQGWPTFVVNLLTLLTVAAYTWYARDQVRESIEANSISQRALSEVNKPYVMFAGLSPLLTSDAGGNVHLHINPIWTNFGNTPASDVAYYQCDPIIRTDNIVPALNCSVSARDQPVTVIGPRQSTTPLGAEVSKSDLDDTRTFKKQIYIHGFVKYHDNVSFDQYGNIKPRISEFCKSVTEIDSPTTQSRVPLGLVEVTCPEFNCVDEACRYVPPTGH